MKRALITGLAIIIIAGLVSLNPFNILNNSSENTNTLSNKTQTNNQDNSEEKIVTNDDLGSYFIFDGQEIINNALNIDCTNFYYEWETDTLSCEEGKSQLEMVGNDEITLGKAYKSLDSQETSNKNISLIIKLIDKFNNDLNLEIVNQFIDSSALAEIKEMNSHNKTIFQSLLDSN